MSQKKGWKSRFPHVLDEYQPFDDGTKRFACQDSSTFIHILEPGDVHLDYIHKYGFRIPALIPKGFVKLQKDLSQYSPQHFAEVLGK